MSYQRERDEFTAAASRFIDDEISFEERTVAANWLIRAEEHARQAVQS